MSPDFNPMENAWSYLDREIRKVKGIKDISDLQKKLKKLWKDYPKELIRTSIDSMPARLKACLQLKCERTSY
jgi:hypothetical protein